MVNTLDSVQVRMYQSPHTARSSPGACSNGGTPNSSSNNRPAPKLRDSCQACSASKVKCNRKKPTCDRCEKRGLTCEYLVTRRAGRTKQRHSEPRISSSAFLFGHGWPTSTPPAIPTPTECGPNLVTPAHMSLNTLLTPPDTASVSPLNSFHAADLFGSPGIAFPGPDTLDFDSLGQSSFNFTPGHKDHCFFDGIGAVQSAEPHLSLSRISSEESFSLFEDATIEHAATVDTRTSSPAPMSHVNVKTDMDTAAVKSPSTGPEDVTAPKCSGFCLSQATTLLQQLFENLPATGSQSPATSQSEDTGDASVENVLSKNKQTVETVNMMLSCNCSQDAYLLAIMSLIVFKVIAWYASVARDTPRAKVQDGDQSPKSQCFQHRLSVDSDMADVEDDDYGRRAGQVVLSELHCVQRLVNQLSRRLKDDSVRYSMGPLVGEKAQQSPDASRWAPFSPAMLDQLEMDLRKGLRNLSSEIVSMLRRE